MLTLGLYEVQVIVGSSLQILWDSRDDNKSVNLILEHFSKFQYSLDTTA